MVYTHSLINCFTQLSIQGASPKIVSVSLSCRVYVFSRSEEAAWRREAGRGGGRVRL